MSMTAPTVFGVGSLWQKPFARASVVFVGLVKSPDWIEAWNVAILVAAPSL